MPDYIGAIHKDPDSDYSVSFPDFPGCITAGSSLYEARTMAEEELAFHIEGMIKDGDAIPEASSLDAVMKDPDFHDGVPILIRVLSRTLREQPEPWPACDGRGLTETGSRSVARSIRGARIAPPMYRSRAGSAPGS